MSKFGDHRFERFRFPKTEPELLDRLNTMSRDIARTFGSINVADNLAMQLKEIIFTAPEMTYSTPTYENSWANLGSGWRTGRFAILPGGRVIVEGVIAGGAAPSRAFSWPTGYAPAQNHVFPQDSAPGAVASRVDARTDGLYVVAGAGVNTYVSIDCSFQAAATCAFPKLPSSPWPLRITHELRSLAGWSMVSCRSIDTAGTAKANTAESHGAPVPDAEVGADGMLYLRTVWGLQPGRRYTMKLLLIAG